MRNSLLVALIFVLLISLFGWIFTSYNSLVRLDENVEAKWSQVLNQYKRRYDLIPNLVATVQGYADHEQETLTEIANLRSQAGKTMLSPDLTTNPQAMKAFQESQTALSGALSRLMVIVERYPDLKANEGFMSLQAQLEGTENRITVARKEYIEAVKQFNIRVRTIPTAWIASWMGMERKQTFDIPQSEQQAPHVEFK